MRDARGSGQIFDKTVLFRTSERFPMRIDRCYCYQKTFADLKKEAEATGAETVSQLQEHVTFGENCRLCHPYVRRMLETGQIVFRTVLEPDESSPP